MAPEISDRETIRRRINRVLVVMPILCSLLALGLVLGNVAAGVPPQADEGAAAHLFQLVIAAQIPLILLFLATADRTRPARPLLALFVQALAGAAALGARAWGWSLGESARRL